MYQRTCLKSRKVFQLTAPYKKNISKNYFHLMYCQFGEITNVEPEEVFFLFPL